MERRHSPGRRKQDHTKFWLLSPTNWLFGVIGVLVVVALLSVVGQIQARARADDRADRAVAAETEFRKATDKHIDKLQAHIDDLKVAAGDNRAEIARLVAEVQALQQQLRNSGQRPVVPASTTTTSRPPPSSTTSTTRVTTTTTTVCQRVLILCIGGAT